MINADAQDLGIESCEAFKLGFVGRYLIGSDGSPGKGKKCQNNIFAFAAAETNLGIQMTF
jgi:hypothetical protein